MHSRALNTYKAQYQQLANSIIQTRKLLADMTNRVINIRALQMDEAFECSKEAEIKIDMLEKYIIQHQQLLQDMIAKLIYTKKIILSSNVSTNHNNYINPILQTADTVKSE